MIMKQVLKVEWIDSCASDMNWVFAEDLSLSPIRIVSFGVLVSETDDYVSLAQNYGMNPKQYCNIMTIPKGCITKRVVLCEVEDCG